MLASTQISFSISVLYCLQHENLPPPGALQATLCSDNPTARFTYLRVAFGGRRHCLTLLGPAATKRQPSGAARLKWVTTWDNDVMRPRLTGTISKLNV